MCFKIAHYFHYSRTNHISNITRIFKSSKSTELLLQFTAILDPASETAQKLSQILAALGKIEGVKISVLLNPTRDLSQLPIKRFYRFILHDEPSFDSSG